MSDVRETVFEHDSHALPSAGASLTTFGVLAGLAVVALAVGFSDLGPYKVLVSLLTAGVQATILSVYFMDLRQADKLTWLCVGAALFWSLLLFVFTLTDYFTRHIAVM